MRPHGELAVEHTERAVKVVVGPPGAPVAVACRQSMFYLKMAETSKSQECFGFIQEGLKTAKGVHEV